MNPESIRETVARARQIEPLLNPSLLLAELPPTTFRCAVCHRRVDRYDPASDVRPWRTRSYDVDECPEHGPLVDVELREWHATWVRRGRPARLTIQQSPVQ